MAKKFSPVIQSAMDHYLQLAESLNQACDNPKVVALRQQARQRFMEMGFPTRRHEDWGYTNLIGFMQTHFKLEGSSQVKMADIARFLPSYPATRIVMLDGWFSEELSDDLSVLPKGTSLESTSDLLAVDEYVDSLLEQQGNITLEPFAVLNTSLLNDGFNLQVSKNIALETPIFVLHVQTQAQHASNLRNRIVVGECAEVTVVQSFVSLCTSEAEFSSFTNVVTEIEVAKHANVKQIIMQKQSNQSFYFHNQFINQAEQSVFNTFYTGIGSVTARHQNYVEMSGDHIETSQNSACYATDDQTVDSRTYSGHNKLYGVSKQLHKYVLDGKATGVFNGMIKVARGAQKTDGQMDNKNLLLSKTAKMDCKPQLEIYADDVKCSHGSATGQIAADQLFYLQARGIKKAEALRMITEAFLLEPVETINHPEIRSWVSGVLSSKLTQSNG